MTDSECSDSDYENDRDVFTVSTRKNLTMTRDATQNVSQVHDHLGEKRIND